MATYPPYVIPDATGITWSAGGQGTLQQLPASYLCSESDAKLIVSDIEKKLGAGAAGSLVNAALEPSLNMKFGGLDSFSPNQPWWITGTDTFPAGPVGPAVALRYVNGVGSPGDWVGIGTGNVHWVPTPPPPPPLVPPVIVTPNPGDTSLADAIMGRDGGAVTERQQVAEILRILKKVYPDA